MARIAFVGDVMLGRLVSDQLRHGRTPESCWGEVGELLRDADGVIANLECAITTHSEPWRRTPKVFHFGADPKAIDVLKAGNICGVSLANNHVLDFETAGLIDTLDHLDRAGIAHAGAGRTQADAFAPAFMRIGDLSVALFAVTDNEPPFAARGSEPGTAYIDLGNAKAAGRPTRAEIDAARQRGINLAVLSCHLGPNMVSEPSNEIRDYHLRATTRGIDVVHGHSAHVTQGVEVAGRALILHDTGDFLDDYAVDPVLRNDWSFVFLLDADADGLRKLSVVPVLLGFAEVRRATHDEADALCVRMTEQSSNFGTRFTQNGDGLELDLA